jgi:hypothetical protein
LKLKYEATAFKFCFQCQLAALQRALHASAALDHEKRGGVAALRGFESERLEVGVAATRRVVAAQVESSLSYFSFKR